MTKIALVTLHYKNLSDTSFLLESLKAAVKPKDTSITIYVVDNEESRALQTVIEKDYPGVRLLQPGANLGFAAGNNFGFRQCLADNQEIIVALNNDTYVTKDFFKQILASPISDPRVGAIGGLIYFAPGYEYQKNYKKNDLGKVIWYAGGSFDWDNILGSNTHVDEIDHGQFKIAEDTAFITGALFITRADVFKKIGMFDEKYFMYLEDVDLSVRLKHVGYRLVFDPQIKIWHKVAQSSSIGSSLNDYFITRNRLYFGSKFARFRTKLALYREALRFLLTGRPAQRQGVIDFFSAKLGKGTYLIDK